MGIYDELTYNFNLPTTILAFFITFMLSTFIFEKILSLIKVSLPHKLNMVILATIIIIILTNNYIKILHRSIPTDPRILLIVVHPFMILKVTYNMDTRLFFKALPQILTLCTIGVTIFIVLMGGAVVLWADLDLLFMPLYGLAIASIDDPEFAQDLKEYEHLKYALLILQGEFIFGAAFSFAGLDIVLGFLQEHISQWYHVVCISIRLLGCALIVGFIFGKLGSYAVVNIAEPMNVSILFTAAPFGTYFLCLHVFEFSAPLTTFIVVFMMTRQRARLYQEIDQMVACTLECFFGIVESFSYLAIWIILIIRTIQSFRYESTIQYLAVYITAVIVRFLTLLTIYPIIIRVGSNWTIKHFIALFWLTKRGILQMLIFNIVCHNEGALQYLKWFTPHTLFLCVMHMIINGAMAPFVMNLIGITTLSNEKIRNVNNCVKLLKSDKKKYVATMKLNRFFMNAKWSEVEKEIPLKEYANDTNVEENAYFGKARESHCYQCNKDIVMEPTKKEFRLIMIAAKLRVLKATKVSYMRQQEKGMITKNSLKMLLKLNDQARDSNKDLSIDINYIRSLFRKTGWPEKLKSIIESMENPRKYRIPRKPFRKWCYKTISCKYYELALYICTIFLFISDIVFFFFSDHFNIYFHVFCILLFGWDVIMKINAYSHIYWTAGVRIYFNDLWCAFDLIVLGTLSFDCVVWMVYSEKGMLNLKMEYVVVMVLENTFMAFAFLRLLRILKIIILISHFQNEIINFCNTFINLRIITAYEIGQAIIVAYTEAIHMSSAYTYNEIAKRRILKQLTEDKSIIFSELDFVQLNHPVACMVVKTRYSISTTLNYLTKLADRLKASGFMEDYEYRKIVEALEKCAIKTTVSLKSIPLKETEAIFCEVPWLYHFSEKASLMYTNSTIRSFKQNEIIHQGAGHFLPGIYVIIEGIVSMTYTPPKGFRLSPQGILPRRDYIYDKYFEKNTKYLIPGNSMGEISILSSQSYDAKLVSVTDTKLILIPTYLVTKVLVIGQDLLGVNNYIWKYLAFNVAIDIFWEVPIYKAYSREDLFLYIMKAFVPDTTKLKIFIASELIEDIILFEGQVEDLSSGDIYVAPCYLPRYVKKIRFLDNIKIPVRLFILPLKTQYTKIIIEYANVEIDVSRLRLMETRRMNENMAMESTNLQITKGKRRKSI